MQLLTEEPVKQEEMPDQLYLKYFSGQIHSNRPLSKQNELYIQHLMTQSEDYKKKKSCSLNQSQLRLTAQSFSGKENLTNNSICTGMPQSTGSINALATV